MMTLIAAILTACDSDSPPTFNLPLDCVPGETCWVVGYVDVDPGPGAKDFTCGGQTSDKASGTQFAIRDLGAMRAGVAVRAAASGVVKQTRDGMRDADFRTESWSEINNRICGNGVKIDHGGGWSSNYCHMKKRSVRVREGQTVKAGDILGLVGMSGETIFPRLHFGVWHDGKVIDPFTGRTDPSSCGTKSEPLWRGSAQHAMPYQPVTLYNIGIAGRKPTASFIRNRGKERSNNLSRVRSLALWVDMFYVEQNDTLHFAMIGPDGKSIISRTIQIRKRKARQFNFVGKRRKSKPWASGIYKGTVTLTRRMPGGDVRVSAKTEVQVR